MNSLDSHTDLWQVRLEPRDLQHGLYSLMLHDPATWTNSGPFFLQFPTVDSAFNWLKGLAEIDASTDSMGYLARGVFVQGTASPMLWAGIVSALSHCAHEAAHLPTAWWYGDVPLWRETSPHAPVADARDGDDQEAVDVEGAEAQPAHRSSEAATELRIALQEITWPTADPDSEGRTRLIEFIAALIALANDVVVVSVDTRHYRDGDAYVQLCREDHGGLTLEAVSSRFLDSPLSSETVEALHELGWEDPPGGKLPNYIRSLDGVDTSSGDVAALLVKTLEIAYGARPGDLFQFAPDGFAEQLLRGDFGPRFMLDPEMSEDRKALLHLGVRFPQDLVQ